MSGLDKPIIYPTFYNQIAGLAISQGVPAIDFSEWISLISVHVIGGSGKKTMTLCTESNPTLVL